MFNRPFNAVLTRLAIVAAILATLLLVAPAASAQDSPAMCQQDGSMVTCTYEENSREPVLSFSAGDQEGVSSFEWSVTGLDGDLFDISDAGVLTFKSPPDFEMQGASDRVGTLDNEATDNVYEITLTATEARADDAEGSPLSTETQVKITLLNVDEPAMATLNRVQPQVDIRLTAGLGDDPDGVTTDLEFEWSVPAVSQSIAHLEVDAHWQDAAGDGQDRADYTPVAAEVGAKLRVKVTYTDPEGSGKEAYTLADNVVRADASDGNTAPDFSTTKYPSDEHDIVMAEDEADEGDNLGDPITASDIDDADRNVLTYDLGGPDVASFDIDKATGQVKWAAEPDWEDGGTAGVYTFTVTAYDPSNAETDTPVTVTVTLTGVNEAPSVMVEMPPVSAGVDEEIGITTVLGAYSGADADVGNDVGRTPSRDPMLTLSGPDKDIFAFTDDDDTAAGGNGGDGMYEITFKDKPQHEDPKDANEDNIYEVMVVATDSDGLTDTKSVMIKVNNVEEAGTVEIKSVSVQPQVGVALRAELTDVDGGQTSIRWQWSSSTASAAGFRNIDGAVSDTYTPVADDAGKFLRATATYRDALSEDDAPTTLFAIEGDRTAAGTTEFKVLAVPDENLAPVFAEEAVTREVKEDVGSGGAVGVPVNADDPNNDVLTYSLSGGADKDKFGIGETTGQITVKDGSTLDYEGAQTTFEVEVEATDPSGLSDTVMVTIMVTDVNEPPTLEGDEEIDYSEGGENAVATYTATDPDGSVSSFEWSVTGLDGDLFDISDAGVLTFKSPPDFEMQSASDRVGTLDNEATDNVYEITLTATEARADDAEGSPLSTETQVKITLLNVDEPAMATLNRVQPQVDIRLTAGLGDDPDGVTTDLEFEWSVPAVSQSIAHLEVDAHWQDAAGDGQDRADYTPVAAEVGAKLRVKVTYTDPEGSGKEAYTLADNVVRADASDGNTAPDFSTTKYPSDEHDIVMAEDEADEGDNLGDPITASDIDDADRNVLTYDLGGPDVASFDIDKATGQVKWAAEPDWEDGGTAGVYTFTVTAYDPSNAETDTPVTVTVTLTGVNEAPSVMVEMPPVSAGVDEEIGITTVLGAYSGADADVGNDVGRTPSRDPMLTLSGPDKDIFAFTDDDDTAAGGNGGDGMYEITFKDKPQHEDPKDANEDNIYEVMVVATDSDGLTDTKSVMIKVNNVEEAGTVEIKSVSVQPQVGVALRAELTDVDGGQTSIRWQWSSSTASAAGFRNIDGAVSDTYTPVADDAGKFLRATATYRDALSEDDAPTTLFAIEGDRTAAGTTEFKVLAVPDENLAPVFAEEAVTREVKEDVGSGGAVGVPVNADDPNNDVLTYSLSGGADKDKFGIGETTGQITVKDGSTLDYEGAQTTFEVEVEATDPSGLSDTVMVTIMVTDVNERPTLVLSGNENTAPEFDEGETAERSVAENTEAGMPVGAPVAATDDDDDTLTYSLDEMGDMYFDIDDMGQITVGEGTMLDYESGTTSYTVTVSVTDSKDIAGDANTVIDDTITVTIMVTNVNETPMFEADTAERSVAENTEAGMPVGTPVAATDDDDDTLTYSLDDMGDMYFDIDDMGQITVGEGTMLDYESGTTSYTVTVSVTDSKNIAGDANTVIDDTITVTIMVTDVNETPMFEADTAERSVAENTEAGMPVGAPVAATDDDDTLTYSLDDMGDMYFDIDDMGQITVGEGTMLDYETKDAYSVTVTATDSDGLTAMVAVTIMVTNVNETPMFEADTAERSVAENMPAGTPVGDPVTATDTVSYSDDSDYFDVDASGQITTTMMLDFEAMSSHMVTVTATDDEGASDSIAVTITVGNVEECEDAGATAVADRTNTGLMADCEALLASEDDLGGTLNWGAGTDIADWDGVTVSDGRVTRIWLWGKDLDGTIPATLGSLEMLTALNLHTNMLSGDIPDLSMTSLTKLYLSNNQLTGSIPAWLNGMSDMTDLWLWNNQLDGLVPDLSGMTNLDIAKLQNNMLSGGVPDGTKLPPNASWILLQSNNLGGEIPDLTALSVRTLWLHTNGLTGEIDAANLPVSVTSLELRDNSLSGEIPDLTRLSNLTYLRLQGNDLTGTIPATLGDLAKLSKLNLSNNQLTGIDAGLENAADTLTNLYLAGNPFTDDTCLPGGLADVANNDFTDAMLAACPVDDGS